MKLKGPVPHSSVYHVRILWFFYAFGTISMTASNVLMHDVLHLTILSKVVRVHT